MRRGVPQKGRDSVGVARQYGGALGTVENGPGGVLAAYASRHGYARVDTRLFMPAAWFTETSAARRTTCVVPEAAGFQTKPQLAIAMWRELRAEGVRPFRSVVADGFYGNSPDFLQAVDDAAGPI